MRNSFISLNHYRIKYAKVKTLKHDSVQYSASVQFCPGYYSSEVVDLFITGSVLNNEIYESTELQNILWNFVERVGDSRSGNDFIQLR